MIGFTWSRIKIWVAEVEIGRNGAVFKKKKKKKR
jgi:ribosome-associated protein YbcJ (S4-like RNA binding protein)